MNEKIKEIIKEFKFNGNLYDEDFASFIKCCFAMRRKTLVNNLSSGLNLSKELVIEILKNNHINESARAETLSVGQIKELYNSIKSV